MLGIGKSLSKSFPLPLRFGPYSSKVSSHMHVKTLLGLRPARCVPTPTPLWRLPAVASVLACFEVLRYFLKPAPLFPGFGPYSNKFLISHACEDLAWTAASSLRSDANSALASASSSLSACFCVDPS
eukprot:6317521-Amphidinium_carterae.1